MKISQIFRELYILNIREFSQRRARFHDLIRGRKNESDLNRDR